MSAMVGYRPYIVPGEEEDESIGSVADADEVHTGAVAEAAAPAGAGGDKEYVAGKIALLAMSRKGDTSVASIKSLLLDYDPDGKWCLNKDDITRLLNDADVCVKRWGICVPNGMVADNIITMFDTSGDGCVSWEEYKKGAGLVETSSSLAIVTKEPVAPTESKSKVSPTSALIGLSLLLAIPFGILLIANRNTKTEDPTKEKVTP